MIVVEGPDAAGKSTLVKQLSNDLGLPIAPRVVSADTKAMVDLKAWVEANVTSSRPQAMIYDRHRLISEPIYGSILRDHVEPGFDDVHWLNKQFGKLGLIHPLVIYCLPPWRTVEENMTRTFQPANVLRNSAKIYRAYAAKAASDKASRPLHLIYDYTNDSYPSLVGFVTRYCYQRGLIDR